MGSNPEIARIQEWVANWYGTSTDSCPFSREDIRNICRGPMREVLVDFLISRFRTDAQIKVIRSNLFLNDSIQGRSDFDDKGSVDAAHQEEEQELKRRLQEVQDQKADVVKQILKADGKLGELKVVREKDLLEHLAHFEKLESRMRLITHRVLSTTALLDDVINVKPSNSTLESISSSGTNQDGPRAEIIPPQLMQLKGLYNKASDLFNLYFLQNSPTIHSNIGNSTLTPEMQALTTSVAAQTVELTQSGLKPNFVEKWARKEQEVSAHKINKVELKFANVMSPVEELGNEAEALHKKLMKAHVNLYFKNKEIHLAMRDIKAQKTRKIQNVVLNDATVVPADFLSFIQREEQQKKLMKCRELAKQLKSFDNPIDNKEIDMLAMICGKNNTLIESKNDLGNSNNEYKRSLGPTDGSFNLTKQEELEELTCALLKSFPDGRNKLESTVSLCKNLVMEKFANLFDNDSVNNSGKLNHVQTEQAGDKIFEALDFHVKIPPLVLKQDLLSSVNYSVPTTSEQGQMDILKEVFSMQNELNESRLQFETLFKEPS